MKDIMYGPNHSITPLFELFPMFDKVKNTTSYKWQRSDNGFSMKMDTPGIESKDLKIKVEQDFTLSVVAENGERKYSYLVTLPDDIEVKEIKASVKNGVLNLNVVAVNSLPKEIPITIE